MTALPALILLSATVAVGGFMGAQYLRGVRNRPVLIGLHFLMGAGGLEVLAMMLRGAPDGTPPAGGSFGPMAAGLIAVALIAGVLVPVIGREWPGATGYLLATHVAIAITGFVIFLAWVSMA